MAKNNLNEKAATARDLAAWCKIVIQEFREFGGNIGIEELETAVEGALGKQKVRQLESIKRDLVEWIRGLTPEERQKIDEALVKELGEGIADAVTVQQKEVQRVLNRGHIASESEYHLLKGWLDFIRDDESNAAEAEKVDELLTAFGTRLKS
jgi:FixJ family two-component response regulator